MRMTGHICAGLVACLVSAAVSAQQPKILNANVSVHGGPLQREIAAVHASAWIGYSVAVVHPWQNNWNNDTVYLEGSPRHTDARPERKPSDPVPRAVVLLRVTEGKVERVQIEESAREIDAGGLPFVWLTEVRAVDSVAALSAAIDAASAGSSLAPSALRDQVKESVRGQVHLESAMVAIALEDPPEVTPALCRFTAATYPEKVRDRAAFWLASERGREGFDAVAALLKGDKDDAFRATLVFDLTLVRGDAKKAALDELLATAKTDASAKVRSKAQFWLAQMVSRKGEGDERIARTLNDAARNDPDAAMRKSAVFALSRLPQDQAAQELIQVASSTKDSATRREAIFWLGQSKDPKALAYLEKVVRE